MQHKILLLRIIHSILTLYFTVCLAYIYYAVITEQYNSLLVVSIISLGIEGIMIFGLNKGDCPLIHVQNHIGDEKPFFELILPRRLAKAAIPIFFAIFTLVAVTLLLFRYLQITF